MKDFIQIEKKYLFFREDAKNLAEYIYKKNRENKSKIIFLDFSRVDFMSRSFADEFLNILSELKMKGIEVKLVYLKTVLKNFIFHVKKIKSIILHSIS